MIGTSFYLLRILSVWPSLLGVKSPASQSFSNTVTFYPNNPALNYLPRVDCVHRRTGKCVGRNYAWWTYDYKDELSGLNRTVAMVTNEHNNGYGNGPREIVFVTPRGKYISSRQ